MSRPNFQRITRTIEHHAQRPPRLTATRWCGKCGGLHNGHCDLYRVPARNRQSEQIKMPTYRRAR